MRKRSGDGSCAKLLLKKSSGHLKISLAMFLASITITSIIGLLYARQYFQYEKDFLENVSMRTVNVDMHFGNQTIRPVHSADIDDIAHALNEEFPNAKMTVIPVYSTNTGLTVDGAPVNLFALEASHCFLLGLDEMLDNTAYSVRQQPKTIGLEINVLTETTEYGIVFGALERMLLNTSTGVSAKTPVLTSPNIFPSMLENATIFINTNTFRSIVSTLLNTDVANLHDVMDRNDLVRMEGLFVYVDDLRLVSQVSTFLTEQDYRSFAPADAFDNFGETLSVTFIVFLLSSIVLLCMTTINIVLSFRSFYRVQQKDMGILQYMGFSNKRILSMYRKNLGKKFLQILIFSSLFILLLGMIILSGHWLVLSVFILSLFVFLCALFFVISWLIIGKYVRQDLLVLIRESKEFE
jgi:hypothetical protein